ncbi:MAG: STAS domain-containing protein, partial [Planctomycetia bacterium]|nr:STAS domain-containing protein [Planctomycetia bacterium]
VVVTCLEKTIGLGSPELGWAEEMNEVVQSIGRRALIVDFTVVNVISSSVIQCLIRYLFSAKKEERKFILCGLREDIHNSLQMMRIADLFTITDDVASAKILLEKSCD